MKRLFYSVMVIVATGFSLPAQPADSKIEQVMLTIPDDPATTAAVSWRTTFDDTVSIGQIVVADPAAAKLAPSVSITGQHSPWETGNDTYMGHSVVFRNLIPGTLYAYRVGNGEAWSEWFQFTTASDSPEPFSILYLGDIQNSLKSLGSRTLRQAYSHFPGADFILYAGDLVTRSLETEWNEFFHAGGWMFGMVPSVPTPGNHEYYHTDDGSEMPFSRHWKQIFTLPENGPSQKHSERTYYMDYQGVRFISLDSPAMGLNNEDAALLLHWLENTLSSNPFQWSVVVTHYPIYSCSQGRDAESYRDAVRPILEKFGVDLVLQGHDHTYCRGQNIPKAGQDAKNYPMYVVSVAGPKMYGLNSSLWADRVASETQLYQHITFSAKEIEYKAFTVTGELYDAFTLIKGKKGTNRVIVDPAVKQIKERLIIQDERRGRYTADELERMEKRANK